MDNYLGPWIVICLNAVVACLLHDVASLPFPEEQLQHWDTVRPYNTRVVVLCCVIVRFNRITITHSLVLLNCLVFGCCLLVL